MPSATTIRTTLILAFHGAHCESCLLTPIQTSIQLPVSVCGETQSKVFTSTFALALGSPLQNPPNVEPCNPCIQAAVAFFHRLKKHGSSLLGPRPWCCLHLLRNLFLLRVLRYILLYRETATLIIGEDGASPAKQQLPNIFAVSPAFLVSAASCQKAEALDVD